MKRDTTAGWLASPWLLPGLVGLALVLRLYRLTALGFWVDELFTLKAVQHLRTVDAGHFFADLHGPLYTGLAALLAPLLPGEWLRLVSALVGAAAVWPVHAWVRRVAGPASAALAGLLAALSPFAVWYGQELRNYSLVLLLAPTCLLAAEGWRVDGGPRRGAFFAFVLCAWLGLLANLSFLLFLLGLGLALIAGAGRGRRRVVLQLCAAAGLVVLLCLPWVLSFVDQMAPQRLVSDAPAWDESPLRGETTFTPLALPYTIFTLIAGYSYGPSLPELHEGAAGALRAHLPALASGGLVLGTLLVVGFLSLSTRRRLDFAILFIVALGLASFLAVRNFKVYNVRYVSMLWPLLLLLLTQGLMQLRVRRLQVVAALLLAGILFTALAQHYWASAYAKEDVRGAAHALADADREEPILVAVVGETFAYYFRGAAPLGMLWPGMGPAQIRAKLETLGEPERFRLVSARGWEWGGDAVLLAAFEGYRAIESTSFRGVRVYTLEKGPSRSGLAPDLQTGRRAAGAAEETGVCL